ncbi:MAG: nucleoside-diphosphate kinase [Ferruginibacter sp.]
MEQSLVILKPDTTERKLVGKVISRLEAAGLNIIATKIATATDEQINKHYQIDNDDYCTSIVCKSNNISVVTYHEAAKQYGQQKADELRDMGKTVLGWNKNYMKRKPVVCNARRRQQSHYPYTFNYWLYKSA